MKLLVFLRLILLIAGFYMEGCGSRDNVGSKQGEVSVGNVGKPASKEDSLLYEAAGTGKIKQVKLLLDRGANVNARGEGYASYRNDAQDPATARNWTALMIAGFNNHEDVVKLLLENGADIEAVNDAGNTALLYACQANHPQVGRSAYSTQG